MPILTNEQLAALRHMDHRGWRSLTIDITYPAEQGAQGMTACLDRISEEAEQAIADGYSLVVLSDRSAGGERVPVSALMATGAVHHHLVRKAMRTRIGIVVESGEPREVHHFCMLVGYGADAVNPYLAFEAMWRMQREGVVPVSLTDEQIVGNYRDALAKGMRKVFGKMGISTLDSYKGAQIFEAVGLSSEVVDTLLRRDREPDPGRRTSPTLAEEAHRRHRLAYPGGNAPIGSEVYNPGDYKWRANGREAHVGPGVDRRAAERGHGRETGLHSPASPTGRTIGPSTSRLSGGCFS